MIHVFVKHLLKAGVTGDALVEAVREIEDALCLSRPRSAGAERQKRHRDRKRGADRMAGSP